MTITTVAKRKIVRVVERLVVLIDCLVFQRKLLKTLEYDHLQTIAFYRVNSKKSKITLDFKTHSGTSNFISKL